MILRNFNEKITWITHLVIMKLWFDKHVEHIKLYVHNLKNKYDMIFKFKWLKWHNSWIDWIHEIMKFDMQYYWNNYLHKLFWYVHDHNYMNMIWYELLLSKFQNQLKLNVKKHENMLSKNNKHVLLEIYQIWAESFYILA